MNRVKINNQSGLHLFNLVGFEVRLDWSWFFLAVLVTWTLAVGYFPFRFPNLSQSTYWIMGVAGTIGLFFSIVLHELCHSLVGRFYGIPIAGITLFIFGGIAKMRDMPPNPKSEFFMAIVGPLFSIGLAYTLFLVLQVALSFKWQIPIVGVIVYLSMINLMLGIFNLLPGFPLDGGRVFRAILWWWKDDLKWATKIACRGGVVLGLSMIILGIMQFLLGAVIAGLWLFVLGFFIERMSKVSYEQVLIRDIFRNEPIKKYAKQNPISVKSNLTIDELMTKYFYLYYHKLYPVVDKEELVGCIFLNDIKPIAKEKWSSLRVRDLMRECSSDVFIDGNMKVIEVLQIMNTQNITRMIITDKQSLYGIITLKDLLDVISLRMAFEEEV
ncbi:hypothetical protein EP47_08510 [Legionella norrlandica]|uniref:Zinc metalloprotease n=1 Tax=Legionella norrlandica TaxID=1498499 RepID=A0A0A2SX09_9GAMM|nr:site-2 protease family protein [Legionella norrlandica]KGP63939.1 hypothetical protein EP47_08510 [Legionella norrlandica]